MHYHNRVTGFNDAYFARKTEAFEHGHIVVGTFESITRNTKVFDSRAALSSRTCRRTSGNDRHVHRHELQPARLRHCVATS